ncbi:MAG: hypothetical protein R6U01_13235 [Halorubrum sp.]|uniref:BGTF surface domain-containing protein n=1 Tax=Halorubrum sp. TaxID=1879286 RepID=UPI0039708877
MTSRVPPGGANRSDRTTTADRHSGRADAREGRGRGGPENGDENGPSRSRLSALRVVLVALAVFLSLFGAAAAGPAAATVGGGNEAALDAADAAPVDDTEISAAVATDGTGGSDDATRREIDGSFSRSTYTGTAGEPIAIRHAVDAPGDDTAYLLVGGNRLTDDGGTVGFVDVLRVSGKTTTVNTRLIGTNESDVDSCSASNVTCDLEFTDEDGDVVAENLSELRAEFSGATGAGGLARPLVPERYRLAITNGTFVVRDSGAVDPVEVAAESDLVLREPAFHDGIEAFTTADADVIADGEREETESLGALRENGVDRTAVTKGDRVVLGFEATGIWGALSHFAEERTGEPLEAGTTVDHGVLVDLLEADEGVSLRVRQTNPGRNERRTELDLADADPEDVTLFLAEGTELERGDSDVGPSRFYLAIDTSDGGPFTDGPDPGDQYSVEFALEGTEGDRYAFRDGHEPPAPFDAESATDDGLSQQYPYHGTADGRVSAEASFSVRERYLRYDDVTDDGTLLVEADNGTIAGTTSVLPRTDLSATIVRDTDETPNRTESELSIADGNFSVDTGLADAASGTRASYRLYRGQSLQESREVLLVENATNPDRLRLANGTTTNLTVTRDESLANLSATVRNVGQLRNRDRLTLDVDDGAILNERHVTVAPGAKENETFGGVDADVEPGEYPYTLRIDGDEVNGTLIVEADPAVTRVDESDADTRNSTDETEGDHAEDESDAPDGNESSRDDSDEEESPEGVDGGEKPDGESPDEVPGTLLPFGVGTRETVGGTVLVGATYILGHWI